ncbi:U3 small nucleolar RNA-associated protein 6 homolog [Lucilia sericata]|uniref:U3 small nucleolar RNA-associated protein 6 homolog n=1 Tax=Lucilia sericata TaxID=13632 RepID=UPI0018A8739A|nr:U3 small nucleolar RNA-associated protein 6 homolog [Lucilia sericata]
MAEILKEIQERDLSEYEAIKTNGICSDEELHKLLKDRERFETKVIQSKKTPINYIEYIQFEKNTHKWITEKEKQNRCNLTSVKKSIIQRIIRLYRNGTQQFPDDERLWKSFIQFSQKSNPGQVAGIYEKMLSYHGDKDAIWCDYALWAYESTQLLKNVKEIFFRALKRHPTSEVINLTFFDILIKETDRISNVDKLNVAERQLALDRAVLLYRNNRAKITNVSYYLKLLERCEDPKFVNCTVLLQKEIIDDILKYFSAQAIVWDYLAQRELKGYNMIDLQEITSKKVAEIQDMQTNLEDEKDPTIKGEVWKVRSLKTRIELCFRVYEKAVDAVPTEEMWSYFINAMLDLNQDVRMDGELKRHCLAKSFNMGHKSRLMGVEHYQACVEMLLKSPNGIKHVEQLLSEATETHKNEKLYELWMRAYAETQDEAKFYEIFCKANKDLGTAKCVSVWLLALKFYKAYHEENPKKLSEILKEAAKQIHPEFGQFRAYYLEYTMTYESLKKARDLYDELCQFPPPCLELHKKMAEIEFQAGTHSKGDVSRIRKCCENAVHYFGASNVEVWIDLLKFERDVGNLKLMSIIYERAKNTLNPELVDTFVTEYALLKVMM